MGEGGQEKKGKEEGEKAINFKNLVLRWQKKDISICFSSQNNFFKILKQ